MKNKTAIILSTVVLAALCIAAVDNSKSGGLPDLNDRLAALEQVVILQSQEIDALKAQPRVADHGVVALSNGTATVFSRAVKINQHDTNF